jgi:hypothetical protein
MAMTSACGRSRRTSPFAGRSSSSGHEAIALAVQRELAGACGVASAPLPVDEVVI